MKIMKNINISTLFGHPVTFKQKILFVAVTGLIMASIVYTFEAVRTERSIIREEIIKKAEVVTELASHIGELPLISENEEHAKKAISSLMKIPEISFISFYDKNQNLLTTEGDINPPKRTHPEQDMTIIEHNDYFDLCTPVFTVRAQEDIAIFQETDSNMEVRDHVGWVRIGFSKTFMKEAESSIVMRGLIIALIFTIISITLIYKLFDVATKPLTSLTTAVKSIRRGKYPEIPVSSEDEIGTLTTEFNRMSRSIKDREDMLITQLHLSAFAADIGKALTESDNLDAMLDECISTIVKYRDPALARIWIYNNEEHLLELKASSGIFTIENSPFKTIPVGSYEAGTIAEKHTSHYTNNIEELYPDDLELAKLNGIEAYAGYPLIVEKQLVGVLEIYALQPIAGDILSTLEYVVNEIGLGIQHKLTALQIASSLREKEVLLREVHHRVKNNMQVISSLLNLQSDKLRDKQYIAMFNESRNRILAMALVHEKLYRSEDIANIDFSDYIASLANGLFSFYDISPLRIQLKLDIESINLVLDTSIPCGLIINELISNALKHAFPDDSKGELSISFRKLNVLGKDTYNLIVKDNGVGVPADLDFRKTRSLGLQLVTTLVEHQLQGSLKLERTSGTEFNILFREPEYKKRM